MANRTYKAIGLMSGSSMDGLDIAFCEFEIDKEGKNGSIPEWKLLKAETTPFSPKWKDRLLALPFQNARVYAQTHTYFGYYLGELVRDFLKRHRLRPDFIASHGHTVFHDPDRRFTTQIGSGAALASVTGCRVVADFRDLDVALDGEGAPIVPVADKLLFPGYDFYLNIGGIANISCDSDGKYIAFDIGGANQVLNFLANERGREYDEDGKMAAAGKINQTLFDQLNELDYFQKAYPKSLSNQWVGEHLIKTYFETDDSIENKLRTACEQLAFQTRKAIERIIDNERLQKDKYKIFVTGGGALNRFLTECLKKHCQPPQKFEWVFPEKDIILFKEAILMALMGVLRLENIPNCLSSATGAKRDSIGGAIYSA